MVVPATLAATIGLDQLRAWLARVLPDRLVQAAVAVGLTASTLAMTRDALVNGPTWFQDYGMYRHAVGFQGAFHRCSERLAEAPPDTLIAISHHWANNTIALGEFFLDPDERRRVEWMVIDDVLRERRAEVNPATLFVLTPPEFVQAQESPKLVVGPDVSVIPDPAGRPGFYLVRLAYMPDADSMFAVEREERRQLVDGVVTIDGTTVGVRHPKLDQGTIAEAFDGNLRTLARTLDGNPTDLGLTFATPRTVRGVRLSLWTNHYNVNLLATRADGEFIVARGEHITEGRPDTFDVLFDDLIADVVRLDLHIAKRGDVHVHLREIEILD